MSEKERIRQNKKSLKYKSKNARAVVETRWRNKMRLIQYKGGKCEICGYNKPIATVYHLHHINPEEKEFALSKFMSRSLDKLKAEADKCQLLCSNCHAELHDAEFHEKRQSTIKSWEDWDIEEEARKTRKPKEIKTCKQCQEEFDPNFKEQQFCSVECRVRSQKKADRPGKQELAQLLEKHSWTEIGRMYGVSDNAVRKWAKRMGLI